MKIKEYVPGKVEISVEIANANGITAIECHMDDGSIWLTDLEGKEWKQIKKSNNEFTHLFDAWNGPPENK